MDQDPKPTPNDVMLVRVVRDDQSDVWFFRFCGHFFAAIGLMVTVTMVIAVVTRSHIDLGVFGLCGFPIIASVYAFVRSLPRPIRAVTPIQHDLHEGELAEPRCSACGYRLDGHALNADTLTCPECGMSYSTIGDERD